jgi:hypothetical protein
MTGTRPSAPIPSVLLMSAGRALYGAALLGAPGPILAAVSTVAPSRRDRAVARILGARHVAQALVSAAAVLAGRGLAGTGRAGRGLAGRRLAGRGRDALAAGAVVDSLHAASMVGLAARTSTLRRAELADAAVASLLAVLGVLLS